MLQTTILLVLRVINRVVSLLCSMLWFKPNLRWLWKQSSLPFVYSSSQARRHVQSACMPLRKQQNNFCFPLDRAFTCFQGSNCFSSYCPTLCCHSFNIFVEKKWMSKTICFVLFDFLWWIFRENCYPTTFNMNDILKQNYTVWGKYVVTRSLINQSVRQLI